MNRREREAANTAREHAVKVTALCLWLRGHYGIWDYDAGITSGLSDALTACERLIDKVDEKLGAEED